MPYTSNHNEFDEKGSPTLTHAPTVSDGELDKYTEKYPPERSQHLQVPAEPGRMPVDHAHLSGTESRDQATRLVDDLTLLQAEQAVSHRESNELRRANSKSRTHEPEGEDVFNQPPKLLIYRWRILTT